MPSFANRLAALPAEIYQRVTRSYSSVGILGTANRGPSPSASTGGMTDYVVRDRMLDGTIYRRGYGLQEILRAMNKPCDTTDEAKWSVAGYYNPVPQIVGFYEHTLYGTWGQELRPVLNHQGDPVDARLEDGLSRLWRWSRLNQRKAELTTLAANHGTGGIRIGYDDNDGDPRIWLDFDDPRWITRVDHDARGNVTTVVLEYALARYKADGTPDKNAEVVEVISKDGFSVQVDGEETLAAEQRENALGVCPYVLCRHRRRTGEVFGRHAYDGSERAIWGIDLGLSQLDESLQTHIWPMLFMSAAGPKPQRFTTGKYSLVYVQSKENVPQPTFESVPPNITVAETVEHFHTLDAWLRERNPAMILSALKLLSGVSGETLQQVLKPAEAEAMRARVEYESALITALQIAYSIGIAKGVDGFDLGTGTGTREAANAAYDDGQGPEMFQFAARPAIPPTVAQQLAQATASTAERKAKYELAAAGQKVGTSDKQQLRDAGFDESEINKLLKEVAGDIERDPAVTQDFGGNGVARR